MTNLYNIITMSVFVKVSFSEHNSFLIILLLSVVYFSS